MLRWRRVEEGNGNGRDAGAGGWTSRDEKWVGGRHIFRGGLGPDFMKGVGTMLWRKARMGVDIRGRVMI